MVEPIDNMEPAEAAPANAPTRTNWNLSEVGVGIFGGLVLQSVLLSCLCAHGGRAVMAGFAIDIIVLLRTLVAIVTKEQSNSWRVYMWIPIAAILPLWLWLYRSH